LSEKIAQTEYSCNKMQSVEGENDTAPEKSQDEREQMVKDFASPTLYFVFTMYINGAGF